MSAGRVAIVGAGPAGFYAAEALKQADPTLGIDLFDRLPMPFGLARFGIAPDHPRLKTPIQIFERIGALPGVRFFGDVEVGARLPLDALRAAYGAVLLTHGAQDEAGLELPGAAPGQVRGARELVAWYNGLPGVPAASFDLQQPQVVVIGHGNVAIDIARLLARPVEDLEGTDISDRALAALRASRVRAVHLVGRRGPVQARFTPKELRELAELRGVALRVAAPELQLGEACRAELAAPAADAARRNLALLQGWAAGGGGPDAAGREIHLRFGLVPERLARDTGGRFRLLLRRVRLQGPPGAQRAEPVDEWLALPCDLLITSIGLRVRPLPGLDARAGAGGGLDHAQGRLLDGRGAVQPGLYVAGWAKRGPSGVLGTNRGCAEETVQAMLADRPQWPQPAAGADAALLGSLPASGPPPVSWADWLRLDAAERARGAAAGRPRIKLDDGAQWRALLAAGSG